MRTKVARLLITACFGLGMAAALFGLAACGPSSEEIAEMRDRQRQILAKLDAIEKKIEAGSARKAPQRRPGPEPDRVYEIPVGDSPIKGPKDAPVTIIEFSDYQCPFCARSEPLIQQALDAYPTQARFVYKHFPLTKLHPHAMGAALAAVAAQKQGKFWEMHEILFANQRALGPERIKAYAEQLGLDIAQFESDLQSLEVRKIVREDMRLAQKAGVRGTPTIFVNGKVLRKRSLDAFKEIIDPIVKKKATG